MYVSWNECKGQIKNLVERRGEKVVEDGKRIEKIEHLSEYTKGPETGMDTSVVYNWNNCIYSFARIW